MVLSLDALYTLMSGMLSLLQPFKDHRLLCVYRNLHSYDVKSQRHDQVKSPDDPTSYIHYIFVAAGC